MISHPFQTAEVSSGARSSQHSAHCMQRALRTDMKEAHSTAWDFLLLNTFDIVMLQALNFTVKPQQQQKKEYTDLIH